MHGFVSIVNGGFSGEDNTGMSTGDRIVLESDTVIGDQYDGDVIVQESSGTNDVTDIFISNKGGQYTSLPTVAITSSTGSSAT